MAEWSDARAEKVMFVLQIEPDSLRSKVPEYVDGILTVQESTSEGLEIKKHISERLEMDGDGRELMIGCIKDDPTLEVCVCVNFWRRVQSVISSESIGQPLLATWYFSGRYSDKDLGDAFAKRTFVGAKTFANANNALAIVKQMFAVSYTPTTRDQEKRADFLRWYESYFVPADTKEHDAEIPKSMLRYCEYVGTSCAKAAHVLAYRRFMEEAIAKVKGSGKPLEIKSLEETRKTVGEYQYRNSDFLGGDYISIDRARTGMYITIRVTGRDKGVAEGFELYGTNGSLKDIREAVAATSHLWT